MNEERSTKSIFIAWMEANEIYPDLAGNITFVEFPMYFVYKAQSFQWPPWKQGFSVSRLFNISYELKRVILLKYFSYKG